MTASRCRGRLALVWATVAVALIALSPLAARLAAELPACPVKSWLGLPCLGCGTSRAALALARLDPLAAVAVNPLAALGWMGLVGGGLAAGSLTAVGRRLPCPEVRPSLPVRLAIGFGLLANWVYLVATGA